MHRVADCSYQVSIKKLYEKCLKKKKQKPDAYMLHYKCYILILYFKVKNYTNLMLKIFIII
jgi:hypothetical protein